MFCAFECLCTAYPLESGEGLNFVLVGGTECCNPTLESAAAISDCHWSEPEQAPH